LKILDWSVGNASIFSKKTKRKSRRTRKKRSKY
jgi:hypothetical protein